MTAVPPPTRAEKLAWCGFDFANSSFVTVIVTVAYPLYFAKTVVGDPARADVLWLWAMSVSQTLVLVSAPLVGAIGDARAIKKRLLFASFAVCIAATSFLSWCAAGAVLLAWLTVVVANAAFSAGENLVASFLPELASPEEMGRLSGLGWSIGYFGGLASLGVALALEDAPRWIPLATAGFFLVAGMPTFLLLRERAKPKPCTEGFWRAAFADSWSAWRERAKFPDLFRLLWSLFFQQAGVATVIAFAALFAQGEFGFDDGAILKLFILLQLAAAGGAFAFGRLQDRFGSRRTLFGTIGVWLVAIALAVTGREPAFFYVAATLCGLAMGGSQSAGRAMVGLFAPEGRSGAWFGLWGLSTKAAAVAGAAVVAALLPHVGRRIAMGSLLLFFAVGAAFLYFVDERRGRAAAGVATT